MIILLSPAKTIQEHVKPSEGLVSTVPNFEMKTKKLIRVLKKKKINELEKLMHISTPLAKLNQHRFKDFVFPTLDKADVFLEAASCFNGEVYKGLDFESFSAEQKIYAQQHLVILSGLYGILRPLDLIYPYRLEMGTALQVDQDTKNLYVYWKDTLTKYIRKCGSDKVILNLASNEYSKALDFQALSSRIVTPIFKEFKNGKYQTVMMYAKHARGEMAKFVLQNQVTSPEELKMYSIGGYQFIPSESTENEWLFVR